MITTSTSRRRPKTQSQPKTGEEAIAEVVQEPIAQKQKKERKPPRLPDWAIGTRVVCWEHNTFARVEARISNRIALRWEHGDKGGATYTAENLRDGRIVRAPTLHTDILPHIEVGVSVILQRLCVDFGGIEPRSINAPIPLHLKKMESLGGISR